MNICYDENCEQWWHHYWLPVECLWEFRYFLHLGPSTATHPNLNIGEDADLKFKLIYCVAKVDISHIQHLVVAFLLLLLFFFLLLLLFLFFLPLLLFLYRFCLWVPAEREKIRISARKHRFSYQFLSFHVTSVTSNHFVWFTQTRAGWSNLAIKSLFPPPRLISTDWLLCCFTTFKLWAASICRRTLETSSGSVNFLFQTASTLHHSLPSHRETHYLRRIPCKSIPQCTVLAFKHRQWQKGPRLLFLKLLILFGKIRNMNPTSWLHLDHDCC